MPKPGKKKAPTPLDAFVHEVLKAPGFGECLQLCDVAELDHVCGLIPEAFAATRHGQVDAYGLHLSLMKNLHGPVYRYVEELERWQDKVNEIRQRAFEKLSGGPVRMGPATRVELQPSLDFLEHIEGVADHIEFGPWSEADAVACADRLRNAWYKWSACLSSYWMWSQVPRMLARLRLARHNGGQPAKDGKPGRPARLDKAAILKAYDELFPSKGSATAGIVATRFGCTAKRVREIDRERDGKKNEPNPAG